MKASDNLHNLIHSLSQAEKRYVSVSASLHIIGDDSNKYMLLFNAIDTQKVFDEEKLKASLYSDNDIHQLPTDKNYLYNRILKAMRAFHADGGGHINNTQNTLQDAYFLFSKGLYMQAIKQSERAAKMALAYEDYSYLVEALQIQKTILQDKYVQKKEKLLEKISKRIKEALEMQYKCGQLQLLKDDMFQLQAKNFKTRDENIKRQAANIFSNIEQIMKGCENSFKAQNLYCNANIILGQINGEKELIRTHYQYLFEKWKQRPELIKEDTGAYRKLLANYLSHSLMMSDVSAFEKVMGEIKSLPQPNTIEDETSHFKNVSFLELLYCINYDKLEQADALVPEIAKKLKEYHSHISDSRRLTYYYNIALVYFFYGKAREANKWLQEIQNYDKTESRMDLQHCCRILQLFMHYDMGNFDVVEAQIPTVQKFLIRRQARYDFEENIIRHLRDILWAPTEKHKMDEMTAMYQYLYTLTTNENNNNVGVSELYVWAKAKIENKSLRQVLREFNRLN